jgi:hypothetical protein
VRNCRAILAIEIVVVFACATVTFSQNHVPVMQDGKPAVLAQKPVPRTPSGKPDLSGLWNTPSTDEAKILADRFGPIQNEAPSLTPWADERYQYNRDTRPANGGTLADALRGVKTTVGARPELNPFYKCLPAGTPYLISGLGGMSLAPLEIIQTDKRVLIIYEYDHTIRQIWTDGRKHPDPVDPTWVGHSIGTWDGDTLVVDTVGIRSENWLNGAGYVASPALHIIERYRRVDNDTMQIDFTYEDPKAFKKPWVQHEFRRLRPTWELIENDRCYPGSPELKAQEGTFNDMFIEH